MTFQLLSIPENGSVSCPDSTNLSISDNLDIRVRLAMTNWQTPTRQTFAAKWTGDAEWVFWTNTGTPGMLEFAWWTTGGVVNNEVSDVAVDFAPGTTHWIRVRRSGTSVNFWTSDDDTNDHTAVSWTALGTTQTTPTGGIRGTVSTHVTIGATRGPADDSLDGMIYTAVIVHDTIVRADPKFYSTEWTVGADAGDTGSDGVNTWTLAGEAEIIGNNMGHLDVHVGVQVGFGNDVFDSTVAWTDITEDVRALSFDRGRFYELDRVDMGTASLELENFDGKYNSHNTVSPYYPNIKPNVPIRIRAVHAGTIYPLWQGFVDRWPVTFPGNIDSLVSIECSDLFKMLARAKARQAGRVKLVESLNPVAWWRMSDDITLDSSESGTHILSWSGAPTEDAAGNWTGDIAVTLDGVDDHASIANEPDIEREGKDRSYEFWVRPTATGRVFDITTTSGTERRLITVAFVPAAWIVGGAGNTGTAPQMSVPATVSEWHHLVVSEKMRNDGSRMWDRSFYFQGELVGTQPQIDPIATYVTRIGSQNGAAGTWYQGDISEIAVYPTALTAADVSALYAAQFEAYTTQRTDERIEFLLTDPAFGIGGVVLDLDLDAGASEISGPNSPVDVSALEGVMVAVDTERGLGFMTGAGAFRFQNRYYRMYEQDTPVTTFNQTHYDTPVIGHDDDLLYNEAQVAPSDESEPFVVEDAASIAENGRSTLTLTIYPADQNEAFDAANYLVQRYAETRTRLKNLSFTLEEADSAATIGFLLDAELSNRYNIEIPLAGDDLDVDVFLEHITHTIDLAHNWTVEWELSAAAAEGAFWLLGVVGSSELGVTTVLGY